MTQQRDEHAGETAGIDPSAPLNRAERRARRFGHHRGSAGAPNGSELQPAPPGEHDEAFTGRPDQDVTEQTGPGTGGATEPDSRLVHHEGMHLGHQPNS